MGVIVVQTAQNIEIEYEIGGLGERILARLIDFAVFIPFVIALFIAAAAQMDNIALGIFGVVLVLIYAFYDLVFEVFFNGQSIGKRVMKIRVISLDGARPKFSQYLLRWLFRLVDFSMTGAVCALICAAVTKNGQRLGDIVAGTALVKTKPRTQYDSLIFAPSEDTYQPVFPRVAELSDQDIALIHEVIENYMKTGSNVMVYNMADKIRSHLSLSLPPNMTALQFLQAIIKDYTHITAHTDIV